MKKALRSILAFLLGVLLLFSVACSAEERAYLNEDTDKSHYTPAQFAEWMYNRTKTSIKIKRPNAEIVENIKLLMDDYESTEEYLDSLSSSLIENSARNEHLAHYSLLSDILEEHAQRTDKDEIWAGITWRETGDVLNITGNAEVMAIIANQIMARGTKITDYTMYEYKEIERKDLKDGDQIISVLRIAYNDAKDLVEVKYKKEDDTIAYKNEYRENVKSNEEIVRVIQASTEKLPSKDLLVIKRAEGNASEKAKAFIDNALSRLPSSKLSALFVVETMYRFASFVGYTDAYVLEYVQVNGPTVEVPDGDPDGVLNTGKPEDKEIKTPIKDYYNRVYREYVLQ